MPVGLSKRIPLKIDGTKIQEDMENFPVLIHLSDSSGISSVDVTDFFSELVTETSLLVDTFSGTVLDTGKWSTAIAPNASVTVSGALELNNHTGNAHSGASCYSVESFQKSGTIVFGCKWHPHTNHYGSAWAPRICFANTSATFNTTYGTYDDSVFLLELANTTDTANRTLLRIRGYTSGGSLTNYASQAIDIDESQWHDLVITIDCSNRLMSINLDNDLYTFSDTIGVDIWDDVGDNFMVALTTSDYNKENTEKFKDLYLKRAGVFKNNGFMLYTSEYGVETPCYVEIQEADAVNKEAWLWTSVPTLTSGTDKYLYLYYDTTFSGNSSYVGYTDSYPASQVWDSDFIGVWHLNNDVTAGAGSILDSTSYSHDGTPTSMENVTGKMGTCIEADSTSDNIIISNTTVLNNSGSGFNNITIESTVYSESLQTDKYIVGKDAAGSTIGEAGLVLGTGGTYKAELVKYGLSGYEHMYGLTNIVGGWFYLVATISGGSGKVYVNGVVEGSDPSFGLIWNVNTDLSIGRSTDGFVGKIDEVRISKAPRSAGWVYTTYQSNWDSLVYYYTPELTPTYYYHGYVKQYEEPVSRKVCLYDRNTGHLMDFIYSRVSDGYYYLTTTISGNHFIVVFDDEDGDSFNALISDKLQPTGIE